MTAVDNARQHQAARQDGSPAGTKFGAGGSPLKPGASRLHLPPKVPAGVSVAGAKPQEPLPEARPLQLPSGTEQPVSSHMLQLDAQAGQIGNSAAGAGLHNTLYAGQAQPSPGKAVAAAPVAQPAGAPSAEAVALRIKELLKKSDYLTALGEAYAKAKPEEQELMLADPNFQLVVAYTAKTATKGLTDIDAAPLLGPAAQARSDTAIENLRQTLQQLDPAFAGLVANEAMPVFQHFYQAHQNMPNGSGFGPQGITALVWLTGRIAGTTLGNDIIAGFLTLKAWDAAAVRDAMAHGASNAYAIAYARSAEAAAKDTSFVLRSLEEVSLPETRVALQRTAAADVRALAENDAEMVWVAQNVCGPLGSELVQTTGGHPASLAQMGMDGYLASKSWEEKLHGENLYNQGADDGLKLLKHMFALNKIARDAGLAPAMQEQLVALAQDELSCLAIQMAIEKHPELLQGDGLNDVVDLLEAMRNNQRPVWGDKSTSRFPLTPAGKEGLSLLPALGLRLANAAATAFLRATVFDKLMYMDPDDPASVAEVMQGIKGLRDGKLGRILGVEKPDLDKIVGAVEKTFSSLEKEVIPRPDWDAMDDAAIAKFDAELSKIGAEAGTFASTTAAGQLVRKVFNKLLEVDFFDPESVAQAVRAIDHVYSAKSPSLSGVPKAELDAAANLMKKLFGEYVEQAEQTSKLLDNEGATLLDEDIGAAVDFAAEMSKLESESVAFSANTLAGKSMRGFGVAMIGLSFYNSVRALRDRPDKIGAAQTAILGGWTLQGTIDLLVSMAGLSRTSVAGRIAGAEPMGVALQEVLLTAYALLEGVRAGRSAADGETGAAIISGGSAVGLGMMAARSWIPVLSRSAWMRATVVPTLGRSVWLGWVGFGITVVTTVGKVIYEGVKDAHKYEAASEICLKAAGFNDVAAAKFSRQANYLSPVAGTGQMSFLEKYARYRGMTMVALRDWINGLTPDQVSNLSDNVLEAITPRTQWVGAAIQKVYGPAAFSMREFEKELVPKKVLEPAKIIAEPPLEYR